MHIVAQQCYVTGERKTKITIKAIGRTITGKRNHKQRTLITATLKESPKGKRILYIFQHPCLLLKGLAHVYQKTAYIGKGLL